MYTLCLHSCTEQVSTLCLHLCTEQVCTLCLHLCTEQVRTLCLHLCTEQVYTLCLHSWTEQVSTLCLHSWTVQVHTVTPLTSSDRCIFQDDSVVDKPDELGRGLGAWAVFTKNVQYTHSQLIVLAVLNEFTKVGETCFLNFRVFLSDGDDGVDYSFLILISTLHVNTYNECEHSTYVCNCYRACTHGTESISNTL